MTTPLRDGLEITVTGPSLSATAPQILALSNGGFVVAWNDNGTQVQFYGPDGQPLGEARQIFSDPDMAGPHLALTELTDGRIVLVSDGNVETAATGRDIHAQILSPNGLPDGSSFVVAENAAATQADPRIIARPDGGFTVVFEDTTGFATSKTDVLLREFDAGGQPIAGNQPLAQDNTGYQIDPALTRLKNGGLFTVWTDAQADGDGSAILARIVNPDGTLGAVIQVNTTAAADQSDADVVTLANGNIVVTWTDDSQSRGDGAQSDILAQIFSPTGEKIGSEIAVNPAFTGQQERSAMAALPDGGFVIVWRDLQPAADDNSGSALRAQVFNADGTPRSDAFLVNAQTIGQQHTADISVLPDGRFVISWASLVPPTGFGVQVMRTEIHAQIFDARNLPIEQTAGDAGETLCGGAGNDVLTGGNGNDNLMGGGGYDTLIGGNGNDTYTISGNGSVLIETATGGTDTVILTGDRYRMVDGLERAVIDNDDGASVTGNSLGNRLTGDIGNDALTGGSGDDTLDALAGDDSLYGGDGRDLLVGGEGANWLFGGQGHDVYIVTSADDHVIEQAGQGRDAVQTTLASWTLADGLEDLAYRGTADFTGTGNSLRNTLLGGRGADRLTGLAGADIVVGGEGQDSLFGGTGADRLQGGEGADSLTGGAGADRFVFEAITEAEGDHITDFVAGVDAIDLSGLTASLRFIGDRSFTGRAGQISYDSDSGILKGDLDGDGKADFSLTVVVKGVLTADDFII